MIPDNDIHQVLTQISTPCLLASFFPFHFLFNICIFPLNEEEFIVKIKN